MHEPKVSSEGYAKRSAPMDVERKTRKKKMPSGSRYRTFVDSGL